MILDPISTGWEKGSIMVASIEDLITIAKQKEHQNSLLVIDESALSFNRFDPTQFWVAKASRHNGHASIFIGQNLVDVPKGVRSQCTQIFIFSSSRSDAKDLADEYDNDVLLGITRLPKFHFYRVVSTGAIFSGKIDPVKKMIYQSEINHGLEIVPAKTKRSGKDRQQTIA